MQSGGRWLSFGSRRVPLSPRPGSPSPVLCPGERPEPPRARREPLGQEVEMVWGPRVGTVEGTGWPRTCPERGSGGGEAMEAHGRLREAWGGRRCPGLLRGGSRDPGQAISAEIPRKALGELWASINSVCQPSGNRALKCSCYSPECLEPALGKQGSGGEGCFLLPGSVTGAGGMWGGFLPGDMAAFPPWGRPAGCWAVAGLPGCGMAPECVADVCPPPLPSPPRPTARQTSGLGCAVCSAHAPRGAR